MKKNIIYLLAAGFAVWFFVKNKPAGTGNLSTKDTQQNTANLLASLSNTTLTLSNGNILDTGVGVIYDKATGRYIDVITGAVIWQP